MTYSEQGTAGAGEVRLSISPPCNFAKSGTMAVIEQGRHQGLAFIPEHLLLLEAVSASSTFAKSPTLRKLLLYLWEHRDEPISEYAIAIDVFGKRASFDPKSDATVRVQISRLRQKLKEYFETEGTHHAVRVAVPHGSHRLELQPFTKPEARQALTTRVRPLALPAILRLLAVVVCILVFQNTRMRRTPSETQRVTHLPELWRTILRPERLTRVVYPIPVFYSWDKLRVLDVTINEPDGWRRSAYLKPFIDLHGDPQLSQSYSVASDTLAAIQLTRFLSSRGVPLEVSPTASLSLDQYGSDNLIFLGISPTNAAFDKYTEGTNFSLLPGQLSVEN